MLNTANSIRQVFKQGSLNTYRSRGADVHMKDYGHPMEIPVSADMEIPVFLIPDLRQTDRILSYKKIVFNLYESQVVSPYSSVEASIKFAFGLQLKWGCCKIKVPKTDIFYYCTAGAIFDKDWKPVCMCTWNLHLSDDNKLTYSNPVLRISPNVILEKSDTLQKFILGKITRSVLEGNVRNPDTYLYHPVSVKVEKIPFKVLEVKQPDIHTTNEGLMAILGKYQNEICG